MTIRQIPNQLDSLNQLSVPYWTITGRSLANAAKTITKPSQDGRKHYLTSYLVCIDDADAGNDISIELRSGAVVLWEDMIGSGLSRGNRVGMNWGNPGLEVGLGVDLNLVVGAGGTGVITILNISGYTL